MPSIPTPTGTSFYWPDWLTVAIALVALVQPWIAAIWKKCWPKVSIRIQEDKHEQEVGGLRFEIVNTRGTITSLAPKIKVKYRYQEDRRWRVNHIYYYVVELERQLLPHHPRILTASADRRLPQYENSWYRTYIFRPTGGIGAKVRTIGVYRDSKSRTRFFCQYAMHRWFDKVPMDDIADYGDWKRKKRARGPHGKDDAPSRQV